MPERTFSPVAALAACVSILYPVAMASPPETTSVTWCGASRDCLRWDALATPVTYRVHRGASDSLACLAGPSFDSCAEGTTQQPQLGGLSATPAPGALFWYLVTATDGTGEGTAGASRTLNGIGACRPSCLPAGAECADDAACCGLSCVGGRCQSACCRPLQQSCTEDGQCCSGACAGGVCATALLAVTGTDPADGATALASTTVRVSFNKGMNPLTLTAQSVAGPCSGSVQVSADEFASCVALSSPAMGSSNTSATFTAAPGLLVGRSYRVRVTTAAMSLVGEPLRSTYAHVNGFTTTSPNTCDGSVVISQVYVGSGRPGSYYAADFVELHNRGSQAVSVAGWSLQYAPIGSASWQKVDLTGSIAPGGYFLVRLAGGSTGIPLPPAEAQGAINLASIGKLALVASTQPQVVPCPSAIDFVPYGATSECGAVGTASPAPAESTALHRALNACVPGNEFDMAPPTPRNGLSGTNVCGCMVRNESGDPGEVDWCAVFYPSSMTAAAGSSTETVYARVYEAGMADPPLFRAQVGFGPATANPQYQAAWSWTNASFNVPIGNELEFQGQFVAPAAGTYRYAYRFSLDRGLTWTVCDLMRGDFGAGANPGLVFRLEDLPVLTVTP